MIKEIKLGYGKEKGGGVPDKSKVGVPDIEKNKVGVPDKSKVGVPDIEMSIKSGGPGYRKEK